jgi:hypothetical protein
MRRLPQAVDLLRSEEIPGQVDTADLSARGAADTGDLNGH